MNPLNVTFDLETLGNTYNAPIIQIGAVEFNYETAEITSRFVSYIDIESLNSYDFKPDYSTIKWWLNKPKETIDNVFFSDNDPEVISVALLRFSSWIKERNKLNFWSHATFDPVILRNAYEKAGFKFPIPYKRITDIRTITSLYGKKVDIETVGVHHNALDDCIYQARYISKILQSININEETS